MNDIIMKHGFEIGLVIAWITGAFVLYAGGDELKKSTTGNVLRFLVATLILLVTAMYFGLRLMGVNP